MSIFAIRADERVQNVYFTEDTISVDIMDGRTITVPLAWYPKLLAATSEQREKWQVCGGGYGIHWSEIDERPWRGFLAQGTRELEDLSTEGLLRGAPAPRSQFKDHQ